VSFDAGGCTEPLWLLFNLRDDSGTAPHYGIYAMRADGTGGHMVSLPNGPAMNASVSPDGSRLLYATPWPPSQGAGDSALYAYDFATQKATPIVITTGLTYSAMSPDGQHVSYVSGYDLRSIDADGGHDLLLIPGPNDQGTGYGHPVFDSDSRTIVYATGGIIGAIGFDGSDNRTLLDAIPGSFQYPNPAFSPDYQRIVVGLICAQSSPYTLRVYPFASLPGASCESGQILTSDLTQGSSPNSANDPSWGPNGLIAYASGYDVFVIDENGGTPRNMTAALTGDAGTVSASDPVWAPGCAQIP
jgi:Tol biopolymer transport system component